MMEHCTCTNVAIDLNYFGQESVQIHWKYSCVIRAWPRLAVLYSAGRLRPGAHRTVTRTDNFGDMNVL